YTAHITGLASSYHYNIGIGDGPGVDSLTSLRVNVDGGTTVVNSPWGTYCEESSAYNDASLAENYAPDDSELILRNSEIGNYDLTDDQFDWQGTEYARYFQPVIWGHDPEAAGADNQEMDVLHSSNSSFTVSSSYGNDLAYLYDDDLGTFGYLSDSWIFDGTDGRTTFAPGYVLANIEFTDGSHDLTGMLLYQHAMHTLREVSIELLDSEAMIVYSQIYSLPESQRIGGDKVGGTGNDALRPGQPKYIPFPGTMEDIQSIVIRAHRQYETVDTWWEYGDKAGLSEIEVFGDDLNQPNVHYYEYFEAIDRSSDIGGEYLDYQNMYYADEMIDNGDDAWDENEEFGFISGPRQSGAYRVDIYNRRNQAEIKDMRWQLGYSTLVLTTTEFCSYEDCTTARAPEIGGPWDDPFCQFLVAILILIGIVVVAALFWYGVGLVAGAVLGGMGTVTSILAAIGSIYSGIVVAGAITEIYLLFIEGINVRYQKGGIYEDDILARVVYDWIYDIDGTVGRIVVMGFIQGRLPYDFAKFEWYGEEYCESVF
ncbi:MAG: hypothetical protein ACFFC6_11475, partial [Promethearchaeota archaeon]